jgi:outer membrane lipoprotein carrier protein
VRVLALITLLGVGAAGASQQTTRPADPVATELAESLQRKYATVRDFSADFVQTYQGGVLKRQLTDRGQMLIKKPGMMRWEYKSPDQKLFVSDGVKIYMYIPADRQVIVDSVPPDDQATTPVLFLAGKGHLTRDFDVSMVATPPGMPQGARALKLVPRKPQTDYDWLILTINPQTLGLLGLTSVDAQGGTSTFSFTNMKENLGLADKAFEFKIPRGVDVVTNSPAR